jgi:protein-S-isoprenylcysteine O-methyltransferase Ste14
VGGHLEIVSRDRVSDREWLLPGTMTVYSGLIKALWLGLFAYWMVAAIGAKRNVGTPLRWKQSGKQSGSRLGMIIVIVLALRMIPVVRDSLQSAQAYVVGSLFVGAIGVVLCVLGIGLALWARLHLGRNWGMPMSTKENPELVTTGPYAFVRHPIYTGILLAMLGSGLGENVFWVLPLVPVGAFFVYSARREEELMTERFPEQYRRTCSEPTCCCHLYSGDRDAINSYREGIASASCCANSPARKDGYHTYRRVDSPHLVLAVEHVRAAHRAASRALCN